VDKEKEQKQTEETRHLCTRKASKRPRNLNLMTFGRD